MKVFWAILAVLVVARLLDDHPDVVPGELAGRVAELQGRLLAEGIGVRVVPSGEVDLAWAMGADDDVFVGRGSGGRHAGQRPAGSWRCGVRRVGLL